MRSKISAYIENTGGIRLTFILLLFALLPSLSASTFIYFFQDKGEWLLQKNWLPAISFYFLVTVLMSFALTPTTVVAIISGYFFGWWGILGLSISYVIASYAGLHFGGFLYHYIIGEQIFENKKLQTFLEKLHEEEFLLVFFGKLSPVFPFAMMNIVFATIKPEIKKFLLAGFLGAAPRLFLFFYLGKNVNEIWQFIVSPTLSGIEALIPMALVIVSSIGIIWIFRRALKNK